MPKTTHIPSPDEIAARVAARELGVTLADPDTVGQMAKTVEALERRAKGGRSAKELREAMDLLFEEYDFNPARELIEMVVALRRDEITVTDGDGRVIPTKATELRVRILSDLMAYSMPKLKSVEVTGHIDHNHNITVVRYGEDGSIKKERSEPIPVGTEVVRG